MASMLLGRLHVYGKFAVNIPYRIASGASIDKCRGLEPYKHGLDMTDIGQNLCWLPLRRA